MPRSGTLGSAPLAALVLAALSEVGAQTPKRFTAAEADKALRAARSAQAGFERTRLAHLPPEPSGPSRCDERIGRFCYWYDPSTPIPPVEPPAIMQARERLLATLDTAARGMAVDHLSAGDWIAGQRVRYLIEQSQPRAAMEAVRGCQGVYWWCSALDGLARHAAGDHGATAAFDAALDAMPEEERCKWTDLSVLFKKPPRSYRTLSCRARQAVNARIWWLAQPLYSSNDNDRSNEHYARLMMMKITAGTPAPFGTGGDADERELTVRYGWPVYWSRREESVAGPLSELVVGHDPVPSYDFFPSPLDPLDLPETTEWKLGNPRAYTRYAPPYARFFGDATRVQFARFRRGDSTLTVAAFDLTTDTLFPRNLPRVALAVSRGPARRWFQVGWSYTPMVQGVVQVTSEWPPVVLSLEAIELQESRVARRRVVAPPAAPVALSDLLLFRPGAALGDSLADALRVALRAPVVPRGGRVGVYWEAYEPPDSAGPAAISLMVVRARSRGREVDPLGRMECVARQEPSMAIAWTEAPLDRRPIGRSVVLDLGQLHPGRYEITLRIEHPHRPPVCSRREIEITKS